MTILDIVGQLLAIELALIGTLFLAAGRWDLPWFWAVAAVHVLAVTVAWLTMDPELRRERLRPRRGRDEHLRRISAPLLIAHLAVAGLDVGRYHWSPPLPAAVQATGFVIYTLSVAFVIWAIAQNRFFSPVVRIQARKGHHVISTGPYRFVRHPGYTGMIVASITEAVAFGSLYSLIPLVPFILLIVRRTILEDSILRDELDGYSEYANRVRFRLVPGLW
jgi:protein-S-isoprenylcysteine O-methyltransferase Ste14